MSEKSPTSDANVDPEEARLLREVTGLSRAEKQRYLFQIADSFGIASIEDTIVAPSQRAAAAARLWWKLTSKAKGTDVE